MTHRGIPIVGGSLVLFLGLTPCSSNAQPAATSPTPDTQTITAPPPPERQGTADQPAKAPPDRSAEKVTAPIDKLTAEARTEAYKSQLSGAVAHVRKAEVAGNAGNIPEMLKHANLS